METFSIRTRAREELVDITAQIRKIIQSRGVTQGICIVYVPHTTAGITINENADPSVKSDIRDVLMKLVPESPAYRHMEGNADSHVKASLMGSSVTLIVNRGDICLGTWQGIHFCEFDGPRTRTVWIKTLGTSS